MNANTDIITIISQKATAQSREFTGLSIDFRVRTITVIPFIIVPEYYYVLQIMIFFIFLGK